ncbi:asialoglycoprotein receptor 1-like isoform X2 [Stegostoma tigrinum]|uniref:asialoglycoprotein receptor 1-like isoform X2 n=1 Tax=Stegostoma tigrinum TaxID=3053191 RepID=UPI00202B1535|nr:asialoglycoprotein receptor 1-like isoform X2 [Stegostoma tigrinum]
MAGEQDYYDFEKFDLDSEEKHPHSRQRAGNAFKSISSGKVLMFLNFIVLGLILMVLVTAVIKWSQMNSRVKELPPQAQTQISQALTNVSENSDLKDFKQQVQDQVTQMSEGVLTEFLQKIENFMNTLSMKIKMLPEPACQKPQCPQHWIYFNESCYLFSTKRNTWTSSKMYCSLQQSYLHFVTVESDSKEYWIGLADHKIENNWQWEDGTDYETNQKFWSEGEPNDAGNQEDCAHMNVYGLWNDNVCSSKFFFICEKRTKPDNLPDGHHNNTDNTL